jgi:hypothetical protein
MWRYPYNRLTNGNFEALYQRTAAAQQLGHEVVLTIEDDGMVVRYRKLMPPIPEMFRY